MSVFIHAFLLLSCFMLIAFFEGIETGVLCVSRMRLIHLVRNGVKAAKTLAYYVNDIQRFIATVLVGSNLFNVILSVVSASMASLVLPHHKGLQSLWAMVVVCMVVFFSEYLPKLFFSMRPLRRTLWAIRVFDVIEKFLYPLAKIVLVITELVIPKAKHKEDQRFLITREYIEDVVSDPRDGAQITSMERAMIHRALGLHGMTASQIMTPVEKIISVTENMTMSDCFQKVRDSGYVRMPVFTADGSRCVGVLGMLDVFAIAPNPADVPVRTFMRPPIFVDPAMPADDLLPMMRKKRQHMVFVRNDERKVAGIITVENILTVLTGNLV
jgi:CBS domain containing-hemolysin-like protein